MVSSFGSTSENEHALVFAVDHFDQNVGGLVGLRFAHVDDGRHSSFESTLRKDSI